MSPSPDRNRRPLQRCRSPRERSRSPSQRGHDLYRPIKFETERRRNQSPRQRSRSPDSYRRFKPETQRQRSRSPRRRSRSPRRRSRSPELYRPSKPETQRKRSRSPGFERELPLRSIRRQTPLVREYNLRPRREKVVIDEKLVIDLVTPEPEAIPVENSVIEEINAANILHPFGTYTVPVHQSSLSILDPTPYPLPIARQTSPHRDGEGIQGIVAAFQGLESHRADAFGGPRKVDLPSHPLPRRLKDTDYEIFGGSRKPDLPSHPLPQRLKVADPDAFGGSRKPDCPFSHRVVSSLEHDDSDARFVPSSYQSVIARNPEPFSGKVVNDLNRTAAKKLASEMLEMPLYKNGVYYYIFWTDGSFCRPKTGNEGGAAAVWIDPERQEWHSVREKPLCQPTNSHDTELLGIELALWQASSFIAKFQQDYPSTLNARHEVFVFTDSSASLHMIPRAHLTPLCKDWAREYLLTKILNAGAVLKRLGAHTQLHWVPGHDRVIGNVIADREAKSAAHGDYVGRQVAWGPWRQASPVTLIHTTESHMTEQEMDLVTRFKALVHTDDYVSLL